jgi:hypothetical protein
MVDSIERIGLIEPIDSISSIGFGGLRPQISGMRVRLRGKFMSAACKKRGCLRFPKSKQEYIANGVQLTWYIDRPEGFVEIHRADGSVDRVEGFDQVLSGEQVLPGFSFDLKWMR